MARFKKTPRRKWVFFIWWLKVSFRNLYKIYRVIFIVKVFFRLFDIWNCYFKLVVGPLARLTARLTARSTARLSSQGNIDLQFNIKWLKVSFRNLHKINRVIFIVKVSFIICELNLWFYISDRPRVRPSSQRYAITIYLWFF